MFVRVLNYRIYSHISRPRV